MDVPDPAVRVVAEANPFRARHLTTTTTVAEVDEIFGPTAMAIYLGDVGELDTLLKADPALATHRSSTGHPTLLQLVACEARQLPKPVEVAELLVGAGAETSEPLVAAAGCGSAEIVEFLLDGGTPVDDGLWTPLDEALYWANLSIADYLVERGSRVRALSTAAGLGSLERVLDFFDGDRLGEGAGPVASPFSDTIGDDEATSERAILDHAFVMAVNCGRAVVAAELNTRGADLNARPPGYHWRGTALHAACWRGDEDLVRWLIKEGADPSITDGLANSDAAGWAVHHGHPGLVSLLC